MNADFTKDKNNRLSSNAAFHIRYAKLSDIRRLLPLYQQLEKAEHRPLGAKTLKLILKIPSKKILLIENELSAIVGLLEFTVTHKLPAKKSPLVVYFDYIVVDANHRRHGFGAALFRFAIEEYRRKGCTDFYSEALLDNQASQIFHKRLGFQDVESVVRYHLPINT